MARAFDLDYKGVEISSGGQRIHNVDILKTKIKEKGLIVSSFETYLKTLDMECHHMEDLVSV